MIAKLDYQHWILAVLLGAGAGCTAYSALPAGTPLAAKAAAIVGAVSTAVLAFLKASTSGGGQGNG